MTWPQLAIQAPPTYSGLDEAIENLFGYDWLLFINENAARFFLERSATRGMMSANWIRYACAELVKRQRCSGPILTCMSM
jgi:uroporphyrinogen-III synthase